MRYQSPTLERPSVKLIRYNFEFSIQQIKISIKFPCKLTLSCNYNEGTLRGTKIVPLLNGIAKINETIRFSTTIKFDEERDRHEESKANIQVSLITQSGTSLAGIISISLDQIIQGSTKEMFQIQRCPDKQAIMKMKVKFKCIGEKGFRTETVISPDRDIRERGDSSQTQITLHHRQRRNDSIKTSELMKEQVSTWKNKVNQFQSRYRSEKIQNNKLNEMLKSKEEIYLSLKTEIKRKQIQIQTVNRTLEEYKAEYTRVRSECQLVKKERDRFQNMCQNIEKLTLDRMGKLEGESIGNIKKIEKLLKQNERLKKEKETGSRNHIDLNLSSTGMISELRRDNDQMQKQLRTQKQTYEKQLKQSKMLLSDKDQSYNELVIKYETISRKLQKLQQNRVQQLQKISYKMSQIQKSKQTVNTELHILKKQRSRKDLGAQGHMKNIQRQLSDQSINNMRLAQTITQLQGQKIKLQKQAEYFKNQMRIADEEKSKCQRQVDHLKYQIESLNELLFSKNNQIKQLSNFSKQYEDILKKKQQALEEEYAQQKEQLKVQIQEVRRSEQSKYMALTGVLVKKQKEFEGVSLKEQKLLMAIDTLKQQIHRLQVNNKEKIEHILHNEQKLKHQHIEDLQKKQIQQKHLNDQIHHLQFQIQSLNESLMYAKQNQFRLLERQEQNRLQLEQLKQMHSSVNLQVLELKAQIDDYNEKIEGCKKNENQMSIQIIANQNRYRKIESEHRQKIVQLEGERMRLVSLLKQKEKSSHNSINLLRDENEELKKEILKRESEAKKQYDQYREQLQKERGKIDEMEMLLDKATNQLTRVSSTSQRNKIFIEQLELDVKNYKQTIKQLTLDKQSLEYLEAENQDMAIELQNSKSRETTIVNSKDRQIKSLKIKVEENDSQIKQMQLAKNRVSIVMDEVHTIVSRIGGGVKLQVAGEQYQKIMQIRKGLFQIESKIIKQNEKMNDYEKLQQEREDLMMSLQKLNTQKSSNKIKQLQAKRAEQSLKKDIILLNKNNQQLTKQLYLLSSANSNSEQKIIDNSAMYVNQINHLKQIEHDYQLQLKRTTERYQKALNEARIEGSDKFEKVKKQLTSANRQLQSRVQEQEHRIFTLQIQNQRLPEIGKKEDEIKRLMNKVFELEREIVRVSQDTIIKQVDKKPIVSKGDQLIKLKLQKQLSSLTNQNERLSNKYRQVVSQLKEKQNELEKAKLNLQTAKSQFNYEKALLEQEKNFSHEIQSKLRIEIEKLKTEIIMLKKLHDESKHKLFELQSSSITNYDLEIKTKQLQNKQLQRINSELNEEVFNANQKIQQLKWEMQEALLKKDNQIMNMQEELYSINSRQNVRILGESEYLERVKIIEGEKKELEFLLQQSRSQVINQNESIREMQFIINDQQANINIAVENEKKYEQILKSFKN